MGETLAIDELAKLLFEIIEDKGRPEHSDVKATAIDALTTIVLTNPSLVRII